MRQLLTIVDDCGARLIDVAEAGFHAGVNDPIDLSRIWRRGQPQTVADPQFESYDANRKSVEGDPGAASRLIQDEIDAGFVRGVQERWRKPGPGGLRGRPRAHWASPARAIETLVSAWAARPRTSTTKGAAP